MKAIRPSVLGIFMFLAAASELSMTESTSGPLSFKSISETEKSIPVYGRIEIGVGLSVEAANPYDPDEISVDALFVSPTGKKHAAPAFWYVPFSRRVSAGRASVSPAGGGGWRIRFAPPETGKWTYRISARMGGTGSGVQSDERGFEAVGSPNPGYIRVSRRDPRYFEFGKGGTYFPIGSNVSWYDNRGTAAYDAWFGKMAEEGANFARIWFASWGFAQEWSDTGLGDYSERQRQAWELDYVLELAEEKGIYLMLCLLNHGAFSTGTDPEWASNPYSKAAGGFLDKPAQFLSDPRARELFKRRLRYTIARWGYSTNIFSWELWNEANLADGLTIDPAWPAWLSEMSGEIRAADLGRHMVGNSYNIPVPANDASWQSMDFVQEHKYGLGDWASYMKRQIDKARSESDKPFFFGEYGISGDVPDSEGIHLHDGLWGSFISGAAGTGMLWWWDQYIERNNLYRRFGGLSRFLAGEDLAGAGLKPAPLEKRTGIRIYRLGGPDRIFAWIRDSAYSFQGFQDMAIGAGLDGVVFAALDGFEWTVEVEAGTPDSGTGKAASSSWRVELWDPQKGVRLSERVLMAINGALTIDVPSFSRDLAYKIIRKP